MVTHRRRAVGRRQDTSLNPPSAAVNTPGNTLHRAIDSTSDPLDPSFDTIDAAGNSYDTAGDSLDPSFNPFGQTDDSSLDRIDPTFLGIVEQRLQGSAEGQFQVDAQKVESDSKRRSPSTIEGEKDEGSKEGMPTAVGPSCSCFLVS